MDDGIAGLHAAAPEPLPFAPALDIRSFRLERERGDLLVYSGGAPDSLDGVARRYLSHRHEAMFLAREAGAPLYCHEAERASVERTQEVDATFSERHALDADFEVIPIPGHTRGATAFLWETDEHRLLFTGDTLYLDEGEWVAAVLDSSDRGRYLESLDLIRQLDFDVLVPWAATGGRPYFALTSPADARRRIDAVIERVRGGGER